MSSNNAHEWVNPYYEKNYITPSKDINDFHQRALVNLILPIQPRPILLEDPIVTWAITARLDKHNWQSRIIEYLFDSPGSIFDWHSELLLLVTEQISTLDSITIVEQIIDQIFDIYSFQLDEKLANRKRKSIRIIYDIQQGSFFVSWSRLRLLQEARGDFIFFLDADTQLVTDQIVPQLVENSLKNRTGMLGLRSIKNGYHFKPRNFEPAINFPTMPDITVVHGVNGMATFSPANLQRQFPWNPALVGWGEHFSFSTRIARAGFVAGYTKGFEVGLATSYSQRNMRALTDDTHNINSEKIIGAYLIASHYQLDTSSFFIQFLQNNYGFNPLDKKIISQHSHTINVRRNLYDSFQKDDKVIYPFKPLMNLCSGSMTIDFLNSAYNRAAYIYEPIEEKLRYLKVIG